MNNRGYDDSRFISNKSNMLSLFDEPTYLGFKIFFHGIDSAEHDGLLGSVKNKNSARYFLNKLGDNVRIDMFDKFIKLLKEINMNYPFYFQSVEGLDEAWKRQELKPISEKQITINCLESLDLRISALIDLYRKCAFDYVNKREILTDNLREFEMSILVFDRRKLKYFSKKNEKYQDSVNFIGDNIFEQSSFMFHLKDCEFNLESGSSVFSSISNVISESPTQSIIIDCGGVYESNLYKILDMLYRSPVSHYYISDYVNNTFDRLNQEPQSFITNQNSLGRLPSLIEDDEKDDTNAELYQGEKNVYSDEIKKHSNTFSEKNVYGIQTKEENPNTLKSDFQIQSERLLDNLYGKISAEPLNLIRREFNKLFLGNVYE